MAINKIELSGNVLIDLSNDTVTPETLLEGATAHNRNGDVIVGTASGGGGATVVTPAGVPVIGTWDGESEPTDEQIVSSIYFNTALSVEEVNEILSKLTYEPDGYGDETALVVYGVDIFTYNNLSVTIYKYNDGYNIYVYQYGRFDYSIFNSSASNSWSNFIGWDTSVSASILGDFALAQQGFDTNSIGIVNNQQEMYANLISLSPKFEPQEITLSGEYDGSEISPTSTVDMESLINEGKLPLTINIAETKVSVPGAEAIPDSGMIEHIYVNRDLSNAEVDAIIKNYINNNTGAEMYIGSGNALVYPVFTNSWGDKFLYVRHNSDYNVYELSFRHNYGTENFYDSEYGWKEYQDHWFNEDNAFTSSDLSNTTNYLKELASEKGYTYNTELIKGLLSITPGFGDAKSVSLSGEYSGMEIKTTTDVNIEALLSEGKLPLSIKFKAPSLADSYTYYLVEDEICISQYKGTDTDVRIPAGMDIYSVTSIEYGAFSWNETLTSVVIPNSVLNMGAGQFYHCTALTSVVIGRGVTSIGWETFADCTALEVIDFRSAISVPTLTDVDAFNNVPSTCKVLIPDALYDTWTNATNWSAISVTLVKESEMPLEAGLYETGTQNLITSWDSLLADGTVHVDNGVVYTNYNDSTYSNDSAEALSGDLVLPSDGSITSIGDYYYDDKGYGRRGFDRCGNLTHITIPNSVTLISTYALSECGLTSVEIPDSVIKIDESAFGGIFSGLTNVVIGDGVKFIERCAFNDSFISDSLTIGSSVQSIGFMAFLVGQNTTINFNGTMAQWNTIELGEYWINRSQTVHCTDGDVAVTP